MTLAIEATNLGKRYGRHPALTDCNLSIPIGQVVALVGPNGAGKSTLLGLACGLIKPTTGTITVLGNPPAGGVVVAQDTPLYADLSVADHLRLGAKLNPGWDHKLADNRVRHLGLDLNRKAGQLSGGQRAQLALTIAAAKRPQLLIFDEPVAALDPLARRTFLQNLMEVVAELDLTVVLSSHLLSDLERVCDYLVLLAAGRVQIAGAIDDLITTHYRLIGAHNDLTTLPPGTDVIQAEHTGRQSTLTVHSPSPLANSAVQVQRLDLEEMVLAYMSRAANASGHRAEGRIFAADTEADTEQGASAESGR
jgi:ABC-2 type transport system ATP-binding protein